VRAVTVTTIVALVAVAPDARAAPTPIDAVGADVAEAFTGTNLIFYGAAVAETGAMAFGGGDHAVRVFVRTNLVAPAWCDVANVAGYVLPVVVAPAIWGLGLAAKDDAAIGAGSAAVQALALTAATTVLLKWSTGRSYPLHGGDPHAPDVLDHPGYARDFRPFNVDGDWAWPSGHTAATTSVVAALSAWDPDHIAIPLVGYPIATAIGLGMVDGDRHWASDVLAGGLIGYAIGSSVGASFRRRARGEREGARAIRLVPLGAGTVGLAVAGAW
jgi:membrane-associated phospholipid phosphatase